MTNNKQHYLITGGAGFIGSHLAEALLARGDEVTIIDNLSTGRFDNIQHLVDRPGFHFVIDTITHAMVMDRLVSECDAIFHLAAAVGVQLIIENPVHVIETNVLGTHAVLKAAARYRKLVLLASTSEIYGKSVQVPFREDDDRLLGPTTKARWSYSDSKAVDEFLALAYHRQMDLPVIICRFFNTVGPRQTGQYGMVVPRFVQQALRGDPITVYGDGEQSRCFCNVADVVRALLLLVGCEPAIGEVFNVGNTQETTILNLARQIVAQVKAIPVEQSDDYITLIPYSEAYAPGFEDMQRRVPDTGKLNRLTGWEPQISLEETLRQVIAYYR